MRPIFPVLVAVTLPEARDAPPSRMDDRRGTIVNGMTESMQILVDLLTAAAALGAFGVGLWNAYQFGKLSARVDTLETAHNAHVNAPALHR